MMPSNKKRGKQKDYSKYPFMNLSLKDMKGEKWKDIPGFDGYFKISNFGRVWALTRPVYASDGHFYYVKERIRKQTLAYYYNTYTKDNTEQLSIHLRYQGENVTYKVNRLVYAAFVGPIDIKEDGLKVVHKDGDNCNNRHDNLISMNGTQIYAHGLKIDRRPRSGNWLKKEKVWSDENSPRPIIQYTLAGKKVGEYRSIATAAKAISSYRKSIRDVVTKKLKQLHGFVYRFKGDGYKGEYADFSWKKPVTQYSIEGKKMAVYPSISEAALHTGIDANTISKCALRKFRTGSGYVWRYPDDTYHGEYKDKIKNKPKPIVQYSLDGKRIAHFPSVNQASIDTGFTTSTLIDCALKKTKVSHGFVWRFDGEPYKGEYRYYQLGKPVTQHTLKGKRIRTYPTLQVAALATGLTTDNIQKNAKGENKTAGGFVWKYATQKEIQKLPAFQPALYTHTPKTREVVQYSPDGKKLAVYSSVKEAAKFSGTNSSIIYHSLDKLNRAGGGFVWRTKGNRYRGELAKTPPANKARPVTQYNLDGKKLKVFKSSWEAGRDTGILPYTITSVANGKFKKSGGFIWQFGDGPKKINTAAHFASTAEIIRKISKPVIKYSLEGKRIAEYPSIAAAARAEEVSVNRISSAINGKTKSAIGHYWKLKGQSLR